MFINRLLEYIQGTSSLSIDEDEPTKFDAQLLFSSTALIILFSTFPFLPNSQDVDALVLISMSIHLSFTRSTRVTMPFNEANPRRCQVPSKEASIIVTALSLVLTAFAAYSCFHLQHQNMQDEHIY